MGKAREVEKVALYVLPEILIYMFTLVAHNHLH
jgi:hypothetical protein